MGYDFALREFRGTITVTSGAGSITASKATGLFIDYVIVEVPSGNPTFDIEIQNTRSKGVWGEVAVDGDTTLNVDQGVIGSFSLHITNSTADGDFPIEIMGRRSANNTTETI